MKEKTMTNIPTSLAEALDAAAAYHDAANAITAAAVASGLYQT